MDAVDALEDAGFHLLEASNADEALHIICKCERIDVVFTDVNMPGSMDGVGLMNTIKKERPEIGVIVASGMARLVRSALPPRTMFFEKPYSYNGIISAIRSLKAA